jgi:hypothetical protein
MESNSKWFEYFDKIEKGRCSYWAGPSDQSPARTPRGRHIAMSLSLQRHWSTAIAALLRGSAVRAKASSPTPGWPRVGYRHGRHSPRLGCGDEERKRPKPQAQPWPKQDARSCSGRPATEIDRWLVCCFSIFSIPYLNSRN